MWPRNSSQRKQVQALLSETIRTLCKNTLAVSGDVTVEGLLGITVNDSEVILVNINELVQCRNQIPDSSEERSQTNYVQHDDHVTPNNYTSQAQKSFKRKLSCDPSFSQSHDVSSISSSSRIDGERGGTGTQENKRRRTSNSNEAAPSAVIEQNYSPGGGRETEVTNFVNEKKENSELSQAKIQGYSSIAVVHYTNLQNEQKKVQQTEHYSTQDKGEAYHKEDEHEEHIEEEDEDDAELDYYTESITSDSTVTSDPSQVTGPADASKPETPTYVCSFCSKNFKYKSYLKKHCFEKHNIQHLYKCPYCEQFVVNRRLFKEHILTHEENRPFKCGICGRMFQTQGDLKRHLVTPNVHRNSLPRLMQQD